MITEENRIALPIKTKELIDLLNGETVESTLAKSCIDLAVRVDSQANSIATGIIQDNKTAITTSLFRIESNTIAYIVTGKVTIYRSQVSSRAESPGP